MSSYRQIIYHIVFGTKDHHPTLDTTHKKELFKYIYGIIKNYIKNQEEHHKRESIKEEYIKLLKEHGVDYDEKYLL